MDLTAGPDLSGLIDATELHRYAEALLISLVADGTAPKPQPGVTDVPGYWLAPAIDALIQIMAGEDALDALTRAARYDESRTALFLCLALALAGQGDRVHASWLATAFGDLSVGQPVRNGPLCVAVGLRLFLAAGYVVRGSGLGGVPVYAVWFGLGLVSCVCGARGWRQPVPRTIACSNSEDTDKE